jgi:hypothetical protein
MILLRWLPKENRLDQMMTTPRTRLLTRRNVMFRRQYLYAPAIILIALLGSCTSRYRLDLYVTEEGKARRVDVSETQYAKGFVLADVSSDQQMVPGLGNCLVLMASTRTRRDDAPREGALSFDEFTRYRIWVELPPVVKPGAYPLPGKSFVYVLGRYDQPTGSKLFPANSGAITVDSLAGGRIYATLVGEFRNASAKPVSVKGQFRAKVKK